MQGADDASGSRELTEAETRKVARLSRLALDDEAIRRYRSQLADILGHADRLRALDLDGVEPLTHPLDATNRLDEDEPGPTLDRQVLLEMAPEAAPPFIRVPKVIGGPGAGA